MHQSTYVSSIILASLGLKPVWASYIDVDYIDAQKEFECLLEEQKSKKNIFPQSRKSFYNRVISNINYVTQNSAQSKQINLQKIQDIISSNITKKQQVLLTDPVISSLADIGHILQDRQKREIEKGDGKASIFPIGITDRGLFQENHAVLGVITHNDIYIIDSKNNTYDKTIKTLHTNFQNEVDQKNCGLYTAYTAIQLAYILTLYPESDIPVLVDSIPQTKVQDLQAEYLLLPQCDLKDWELIDDQEIDVTPEGLPLCKVQLNHTQALPEQVYVDLLRSHNVTFMDAETQPNSAALTALRKEDIPTFLKTHFPKASHALRDVLSGHFHQGSFPYTAGYNSQLAISQLFSVPRIQKTINRYIPETQGGHLYFAESKRHIFVAQDMKSTDSLNVVEVYIQTPTAFNGDASIPLNDSSVVFLSTGKLTANTDDGKAFFKCNDSLIISANTAELSKRNTYNNMEERNKSIIENIQYHLTYFGVAETFRDYRRIKNMNEKYDAPIGVKLMEKILQYTPPVYSGTEETLHTQTPNQYNDDSSFQIIESSYHLKQPLHTQEKLEQDMEALFQKMLEPRRPKGFFSKLRNWW